MKALLTILGMAIISLASWAIIGVVIYHLFCLAVGV
jgi:hypothetical protein